MSNTLKLGNGQWATGKDTVLAYNDLNSNYKPLAFSFSRASSGTVVNKDGLIETVGSGEPRIDFKDNTKGALLLEPSRSNYSAYSELTSTWTYTEFGSGSAGTITTGKTDMFGGTNAVQIDFPSDAENVAIRFGSASSSLSSGDTSVSIYIKLVEIGSKDVQLRCNFTGLVNVNSTEFTRVDLSGTKTNSEAFNLKLRPSEGTSSGGFSIIVCHPQEEEGSYTTSYIPTSGSAATRVAESSSQTVPDGVIGQTEGTLFAEFEYFGNTSGALEISPIYIGTGTYATAIYADIYQGELYAVCFNSGVNQASINCGVLSVGTHKVAIGYSNNDIVIYLDGLLGGSDTSATIPECNRVYLGTVGTSTSVQKYTQSEAKLYNTRLSNSELAALTS